MGFSGFGWHLSGGDADGSLSPSQSLCERPEL